MEATPKLTARQAAILGAFTGTLCGDFGDMHAYIKEKMERPVWMHEMANADVMAEIKEACRADFLALIPGSEGASDRDIPPVEPQHSPMSDAVVRIFAPEETRR